MKLTETQLKNIITESVKKHLNEISWQKAKDAAVASDSVFDDFESILGSMENVLNEFDECFGRFNEWYGVGGKMQRNQGSMKYFNETETIRGFQYKAKELYNEMKAFYDRKQAQVGNLSNMADEKFKETHNGKNYDTAYNEYMNSDSDNMTPENQEMQDYESGNWKNR